MATKGGGSSTAQGGSQGEQKEDLVEFCTQLDDYTPTVSV